MQKLTQNGFTNLNVRHKIIKHLEENLEHLPDLGFGKEFWDTHGTKNDPYTGKLDFMKIKTICAAEDTVREWKRQAIGWETAFTITHLAKDWYSECIENTLNATARKLTRKRENDLNKVRYDCVGEKKTFPLPFTLGSFATVPIKLA